LAEIAPAISADITSWGAGKKRGFCRLGLTSVVTVWRRTSVLAVVHRQKQSFAGVRLASVGNLP
jgi:hypothetical protein